jgi:phage baseplate assembly protein gpV
MSIVDEMARGEATAAEVDPKIYGVVVGRVINVLDPLLLGRVQVQLPAIDALDLSPWARVATPAASMASGFYWIPNPGDEVLVAFEHGDLNAPYIIGCLWSATMVPPLPSPVPQIRLIRTPLGNQIMFTEAPPTITITTASMTQTIILNPTGIQIIAGTNVINMTPDGITISGTPNLNLVATGALNITAPTITINGAATTNVLSAGVCNITAPLVKIN